MPTFTLTSTRDAASCLTFLGRTAEGMGGAAVGFSDGGRSEAKITPPHHWCCKWMWI